MAERMKITVLCGHIKWAPNLKWHIPRARQDHGGETENRIVPKNIFPLDIILSKDDTGIEALIDEGAPSPGKVPCLSLPFPKEALLFTLSLRAIMIWSSAGHTPLAHEKEGYVSVMSLSKSKNFSKLAFQSSEGSSLSTDSLAQGNRKEIQPD
jgi:hypothetical protein